jgi:hypothetical protein
METLSRTLLLRFVRTASVAFLALGLVVLATTSLWISQSAPGVGALAALRFGLDAILVGSEAWSAVLASSAIAIVAQSAAADRHLLMVAMAGRSAWRPFVACWVAVACACVVQVWLFAEVLPEANYRMRWPVQQAASIVTEALRARSSASLGPIEMRAIAEPDGSCSDFVLAAREGGTAMVVSAARASIGTQEDPMVRDLECVRVDVREGRLVVRDPETVFVNVAFDGMHVEVDSKLGGRPSRRALLPLSYYRSSELHAYGQQKLVTLRSGKSLQEHQSLRADSLDAIQALRVVASFHPLFAVVLMTLAVARPRARSVWAVVGAMAVVVVGLVIQIAMETAVGRLGVVRSAWAAVVPPLVSGALSMPLWKGGMARA